MNNSQNLSKVLTSLEIISDYLPAKVMENGFKILFLDRFQLFTDKVTVHGDVHVRKPLVISQSPAQDEIVLGLLVHG